MNRIRIGLLLTSILGSIYVAGALIASLPSGSLFQFSIGLLVVSAALCTYIALGLGGC